MPRTAPPKPDHFDPQLGLFVDAAGVPIPKKAAARLKSVRSVDFQLDTRSVYEKDQSLLMDESRRVSRDADGFYSGNAGKKRLKISPRKTFKKGTHWRVVGENVRVEAMCHYGAGANGGAIWSGWSRHTPVGTILECIGWRRFRRDGLVAPQFVYDELPPEARWSTVMPNDGLWRPWPLAGILEQITDEELAEINAAKAVSV